MQITRQMPTFAARNSSASNQADSAKGNEENKPSLRDNYASAVSTGAFAAGGATLGYFGGTLAGAGVHALGASARYLSYGPIIGGALGASFGLRKARAGQDDALTRAVITASDLGSGASLGMVGGDALGHLLKHVTDSSAYTTFGPAGGAVTGALIGLAANRFDKQDPLSRFAKGAASAAIGTTSGWYLLGGVGALVSKIAGNPGIMSFAPALGAISGGLIGAAAYVINHDKGQG
jgi:hypothetical protein